MIVIGISGKKRHGKDTVARFISELMPKTSVCRIAFGDALKEELAKACGVTVSYIEANKEVFRPALQWWATEFRRKLYGEDYWIKKYLQKLISTNNHDIIVTPDVRFTNEADALHNINAFVIRVERPSLIQDDKHQSECDLDGWTHFDYTLYNASDLTKLKQATQNMLKALCINQPMQLHLATSQP